MPTVVIAIVCITLIVVGGMTMSQGFISSVDSNASIFSQASDRDGEIMRTELSIIGASQPTAGYLEVDLRNSGQVKQASFSSWDVIIHYDDDSDNNYVKWLPYTNGVPGDNEWTVRGIYLDADSSTAEVYEPGILNPGEEMVISTKLGPPQNKWTTKYLAVSTGNGVSVSTCLMYLFAHSETTAVSGTDYFQYKAGITSDGSAITERTYNIPRRMTGRWLLHNQIDTSMMARHIYPLSGVDELLPTTWNVYYHGQAISNWDTDPSISIDVIVRKSDGSIRETIATDVAEAIITSPWDWQTISASYSFPGYSVVNDTDYLEIDYFGISSGEGPNISSANIQLRVDETNLSDTDQTRIENILYKRS
ncbi:MAG: hypothetical protein WC369_01175 [Dehalococcoidales bacterium]|jgi:hypothetical protein